MHTDPIPRYSNGTVDIELYRKKALAMRAQAQVQTLRNLNRMVGSLISVAIFFLTVALSPPRNTVPARRRRNGAGLSPRRDDGRLNTGRKGILKTTGDIHE